jgi:hypothetical protein
MLRATGKNFLSGERLEMKRGKIVSQRPDAGFGKPHSVVTKMGGNMLLWLRSCFLFCGLKVRILLFMIAQG